MGDAVLKRGRVYILSVSDPLLEPCAPANESCKRIGSTPSLETSCGSSLTLDPPPSHPRSLTSSFSRVSVSDSPLAPTS